MRLDKRSDRRRGMKNRLAKHRHMNRLTLDPGFECNGLVTSRNFLRAVWAIRTAARPLDRRAWRGARERGMPQPRPA
jgi:hypothetical protein